ncbi:GTPase [Candidatus Pacearchaeota archaeon CG10_big_fil_rev_8_21_14_0_10_30_48]|nr:MAG: GTPase [Candidatus Pacearchaeota archaeon CG10_big_fil_rev_8_21_14_0_10_30_48]
MVQQFKFKANRPRIVGNTNITPYWKVLENIIEESDIILEILDARMPELSRNEELEKLIKDKRKRVVFILNKSDLVPKELVKKRRIKLAKKTSCYAISAKDKETISKLRQFIFAQAKESEWYNVGVVGYPNTGKSSIINSLVRKKKAPISSRAGTTHGPQWVKLKEGIRIIDSPGIIPLKQTDEIRYALIGSKNPEKIKDLELVAHKIIELFSESENLEKHYNIELKSEDPEEIIQEIGRKKGFLKKGNQVDETRVAITLIREWQSGKLRL